MTGTFAKPRSTALDDIEGQQLVLDVEGTRVFLSKKETGKRSQLWRQTANGMLQHEGSSPPQDPRNMGGINKNTLVLDIGGIYILASKSLSLLKRKLPFFLLAKKVFE